MPFKLSFFRMINKKDFLFFGCVSLLYAVTTFIGVMYHEPWRDEAQVWLIVRDSGIRDIFSQLSVQGNLGVWYILLLPFAKLGFPYFTELIVHWLVSVSAVSLFQFKAPLNRLIKVLFVFSYYMLFEYGVIARDYMLTILFLFLIATYYSSRFSNPKRYALLIFLLFNTHVLGIGVGVALLIIYFAEVKNKIQNNNKISLAIMSAGLIIAFITLFPSSHLAVDASVRDSYIPLINREAAWTLLTAIQNAFIPTTYNFVEIKMPLFFSLGLLMCFIALLKKPRVFVLLFISLSWLFYVFITKQYYTRYSGFILVFVVFSLWVKHYYQDSKKWSGNKFVGYLKPELMEKFFETFLVLCLVINSIYGVGCIRKEVLFNSSGAEELSCFIKNNKWEEKEIACYQCWSSSLAAYLPNAKLWSLNSNRYETFLF